MPKEEFKPLGAILVIPGTFVNEDGRPVRDHMLIEAQGVCEPMLRTREGLAQLHLFLLRALEHVAGQMVSAPSVADAEGKVVIASALDLPMRQ